ncbi:MAG TPA: hypothetical protein VHJ78_08820 [Actinomycetota bacterium]|nr:hypothetical protein [Actinomycetota bacterium]
MKHSILKPPAMSALAGRILGLVVLLTVAASSGAVIGIANAQDAEAPVRSIQAAVASPEVAQVFESTLAMSEAPANALAGRAGGATSAPVPAVSRARGGSSPQLVINIPGLTGPGGTAAGSGKAVKCSRFDDAKINWLIEQVNKTKAEHPEMAAGADKLLASLRGALGQNLCASEAQAIIGELCSDPAVVRVMNQMVSQLPFFIRPMVGDPCSADLVSVLNKAGKFVPGLSSEPT